MDNTDKTEPSDGTDNGFSLVQLLPNILTLTAICAGASAIRFGVQGNYMLAVQLIIVAGVLDGLDGRLARALGATSKIGAELDSLADFLNFGVAPPLILYFWAMHDTPSLGWIAVLIYSVCCAMRLARFNVGNKSECVKSDNRYFEGVPSPAGALLVLLPMYLSFTFADDPVFPGIIIGAYMICVGLLLISKIQIWSFKTTRISRENVGLFLVAVIFMGAALLTYAWATLVVLCLGYVGIVVWAMITPAPRSDK